ncbi:MAG: hypothetical protein ACR2G5_11865 [Pyrinomonadaceae bacterium]
MVSAQLEESLRREIETYIEGRLSGVKQEMGELQSRINEFLTRLMERQSEGQVDGGITATILEHLRAAQEQGIDLAASESSRTKASSDMAIVKAAIAEMGEQGSQADVLKTLVNRAASFAPRVAFFAIKGEQAVGWRARGFEGTVGDHAIQKISVPVSNDSIIGDVARSRATWSGGPHSHSEDHLILNKLGDEPPQRIVAVPLAVRGRTVAVLYADSAGLDSEAINLEALETIVRVSAMAVDLLAGRAPTKAPAEESAAAPEPPAQEAAPTYEPQQQTYEPQREYEDKTATVVSEASAPQFYEVEAEPEATVASPQPAPQLIEAQPEPVQAPPPSPVAVEPPPSPVAEPQAAPTGPKRRYGTDMELPVAVETDEERRLHNDARRFARLLVSEIKLYNEQKVTDGRAQNDLYDRLREYIDRSRDMYDKRVKPEVAQKYDYFHHELVNALAEGDVAKLGNAYPGATVSA